MEGSLVAYKVFTNGSVLNASEINDNLMNQSVMVFSNSTARAAALPSPLEGMLTWLQDSNKYQNYNGTAWVDFGGSAILQVVHVAKTDVYSMSSETYTAVTGLSANITPSSTTSKILCFAQLSCAPGIDTNSTMGHWKITRGGTDFYIGNAASTRVRNVFGGHINSNLANVMISNSIVAQDSPASTSALTYRVETRKGNAGSGTVYLNQSAFDFDSTNQGRGASSLTLMEVAG